MRFHLSFITPVVGGILSSLVHILVVTSDIFAWLRERHLAKVST